MPVVEEIDKEANGKIKVGKINIDEQPELASEYGVMSIPTCIKFVDGKIEGKTMGALPKPALLAQLKISL